MIENKLIALVGPNEAGKTSILDALVWLNPNAVGITQDQLSASSG
jgi:predicted ATP-dependent endonuclease of OLD family